MNDNLKKEINYHSYNFIKILSYEKNKVIELISKLDIYKDENNLKYFDEFITEYNSDLGSLCDNYKFIDMIKSLFVQHDKNVSLDMIIFLNN